MGRSEEGRDAESRGGETIASPLGRLLLGAALAAGLAGAAGAEDRHGFAILGSLKYGPDYSHFDYVDPGAPKGGTARLWFQGSFDSLNPFILKGVPAAGLNFFLSGEKFLSFESLMYQSMDEPDSFYALVAKSVELSPEGKWISFRIDPRARFHDGSPITAEDVAFSFDTLKNHKGANPFYRVQFDDIEEARALAPDHVRFTFKAGAETRDLPAYVALMPILSKAFYETHDFAKASLTPPLMSGPYEIEAVEAGRSITWRRVKDHWAEDHPVYRGRYNFDRLKWIYIRDRTVGLQALFGGQLDFREEFTSRDWATRYDDVPAVKDGRLKREVLGDESPSGTQAFYLNSRREKFKDIRVRQALGLVFDFEWTNETLFYDAYKRTRSIFQNSEMAALGPPSAAELELLAPARDALPAAAFEGPYAPPVNGGTRALRPNLREASKLLKAAGWRVVDGKLVDAKGEPFTIEFLSVLQGFERIVLPYTENLRRLGIEAGFRLVESAQYQRRRVTFDYDVITARFRMSLTPGVALRNLFNSRSAVREGSLNYAGIADPLVDGLIEKVVGARNRDELVTATRALDRMVMWNHYLIPQWYSASHRIAYWDVFGRPKTKPRYDLGFLDTWWIDPEKRARIEAAR